MLRRWVCGVVVVAVIFGALGWAAPAMAKKPSDYYGHEWIAGQGGLLGGGLLGFLVGALIVPGNASQPTGSGCNNPDCSFFAAIADASERAIGPALIGSGIGTGLAVVSTGQDKGVAGNAGGAYAGSFLGLAVAGMLGTLAQVLSVDVPFGWVLLEVLPPSFAVIGFNIGAKMKDTGKPASLPWTLDLPVLSLEF